jgi:hypothetical protein
MSMIKEQIAYIFFQGRIHLYLHIYIHPPCEVMYVYNTYMHAHNAHNDVYTCTGIYMVEYICIYIMFTCLMTAMVLFECLNSVILVSFRI